MKVLVAWFIIAWFIVVSGAWAETKTYDYGPTADFHTMATPNWSGTYGEFKKLSKQRQNEILNDKYCAYTSRYAWGGPGYIQDCKQKIGRYETIVILPTIEERLNSLENRIRDLEKK